jgi:sugar phosphate isomerase/epimerase
VIERVAAALLKSDRHVLTLGAIVKAKRTEAVRFAICNETYQGWSFQAACEDIAAAGYDAVEVAPGTLVDDAMAIDEATCRRAGECARQAGLEVVGLHWLLAWTEGLHLTTPDAQIRQNTVQFGQHLARCCAAMGGRVMVWGSPKQRNLASSQSKDSAYANAADILRPICEVAGPLNVTVAMEPLGPHETDFLNTADEAAALIDRVNHPACQLHLDVKAMSSEDTAIPAIIQRHAHHLAHFHANDPNLRGPGFGEVAFEPILAALQEARYAGAVSVEVFDYRPDGPTIARDSLRYLKQCLSS